MVSRLGGLAPTGGDTRGRGEVSYRIEPHAAGTRFTYGVVDCVVLEADEPRLLPYSWTDHGGGETTGLRKRKKRLMRQRLSDTATEMFLERGFDAVRVSEIAQACGVSACGPSSPTA